MTESEHAIITPVAPKRKRAPVPKREQLIRPTQFPYPRGINSCDLKFSRRGRKFKEAMEAYAEPRLMPKLEARSAAQPDCNRYDDLSIEFMDACVYLHAWLGYRDVHGIAEFPFARLYPVKGGLYNLAIRRLLDWSRVEDNYIWHVQDLFWNQAPNAKFWVKIATHKTFEECIDLLVADPNF